MNKRAIGKKYENLASKYLEDNGYNIIEMNFQCKIGEIDIIAKNDDYLCFIEVKFRNTSDYGRAIDAITKQKQYKIINTSRYYLFKHSISFETKVRYDVLCFDKDNISLIKNAFIL